jgi:hypothetical protein
VTAFLDALKAKDVDRLIEATALRAKTEAKGPFRAVLDSIVEQNPAQEDIDHLAKVLEGMNIMGQNYPRSTGRIGIIVGKTVKRHQVTRTITVRKEKDGWKVVDIGGLADHSKSTSGQSSLRSR